MLRPAVRVRSADDGYIVLRPAVRVRSADDGYIAGYMVAMAC